MSTMLRFGSVGEEESTAGCGSDSGTVGFVTGEEDDALIGMVPVVEQVVPILFTYLTDITSYKLN